MDDKEAIAVLQDLRARFNAFAFGKSSADLQAGDEAYQHAINAIETLAKVRDWCFANAGHIDSASALKALNDLLEVKP